MKSALIALALMVAPMMAGAAAPAPFTAQYDVIRNGDRLGQATIRFTSLGGGRYQLQTNSNGTEGLASLVGAAVEERSVISWRGDQPETMEYDYVQKVGWKSKERHLRVDAQGQRIDSQDKDRSYTPPYKPGVLDRHAVTVALMQDAAQGKTGDRSYLVPDKDELEPWRYRIGASATLQTALGPQRAQRVDRIRDDGSGRQTSVWLGDDRGYVPLRFLQTESNGETIEMRIVSIR